MAITKSKIGDIVILSQTTFYVYRKEEDIKLGKHIMCTSDQGVAGKFALKIYEQAIKKAKS
jgi:F0F1-type ATP synthase gamma subunit